MSRHRLKPEIAEASDRAYLSKLPYVIFAARLELKVGRAELCRLIRTKRKLEAKYGRQPRSKWLHAGFLDQVRKIANPLAAKAKLNQLVDAYELRLNEAERIAQRNAKRHEDRQTLEQLRAGKRPSNYESFLRVFEQHLAEVKTRKPKSQNKSATARAKKKNRD